MKTIRELARASQPDAFEPDDYIVRIQREAFAEGMKKAQEWIPVVRDKDGFIDDDCFCDMNTNCPILVKLEDNSVELYYDFTSDENDVVAYRPIERRYQ
jgi:hypothetical protein